MLDEFHHGAASFCRDESFTLEEEDLLHQRRAGNRAGLVGGGGPASSAWNLCARGQHSVCCLSEGVKKKEEGPERNHCLSPSIQADSWVVSGIIWEL